MGRHRFHRCAYRVTSHPSRTMLRRAAWSLLSACAPMVVAAQSPRIPDGPGVDSGEVRWLKGHLSSDESTTVFGLLGALSRPEAIQLLPLLLYQDGGEWLGLRVGARYIDSLASRPPAGVAGLVRSAYLVSRLRFESESLLMHGGFYAMAFTGEHHLPTNHGRSRDAGALRVTVALDFAPAETLMVIIGTPDITPGEAQRRTSTPVFDAMIAHCSQGFYPMPLSREQLGLSLAHAASTQPLDLLYMYAQPQAFLDYGDVRRHRPQYRALLDTLEARSPAVADGVIAAIAPYVPAGTRVDRRVSFVFGDGADGWATDDVAAIDLEFFKDDFDRLLTLLTHETFHAVQHAAAIADSAIAIGIPADSLFRAGLDVVYLEGTATFVAPPQHKTLSEFAAEVVEGARLLTELYRNPEPQSARAALIRGEAGAGPFYWLGAAMSRVIVDVLGAPALAATLRSGSGAFLRAYVKATRQRPTAPQYLSAEIRQLGAPSGRRGRP